MDLVGNDGLSLQITESPTDVKGDCIARLVFIHEQLDQSVKNYYPYVDRQKKTIFIKALWIVVSLFRYKAPDSYSLLSTDRQACGTLQKHCNRRTKILWGLKSENLRKRRAVVIVRINTKCINPRFQRHSALFSYNKLWGLQIFTFQQL